MRDPASRGDSARREAERRRRRREGHRRLALAVALLGLVVLGIGLGVGLSGRGEKTGPASPGSSVASGSTGNGGAGGSTTVAGGASTTGTVGGASTTGTVGGASSTVPSPGSNETTGTSGSAGTSSTMGPGTTMSPGTTGTLTFKARLSGADEVPPVTTSARGVLTLTAAADLSKVDYVLEVEGLRNLTVARLHEGQAGKKGDTIVTIYPGPTKSGVFSGTVTRGSFTAKDLVGPLAGRKMSDFVALLKDEAVYLNVGTTAHRSGEIRGQLTSSPATTPAQGQNGSSGGSGKGRIVFVVPAVWRIGQT